MGDEILVINGKVVSELDMVYVETLLQEAQVVCLTVRSCRTQRPYSTFMMEHADLYIDNMVCRPPPSQSRLSQKILGELTVPAPLNGKGMLFSELITITVHLIIYFNFTY